MNNTEWGLMQDLTAFKKETLYIKTMSLKHIHYFGADEPKA